MRIARILKNSAGGRRLAAVAAAIGIVAALSGCVIYPIGYWDHPHYHDWH